MKRINWRYLNAALWAEVLLTYVLPFQTDGSGFMFKAGIPVPFITVYDTAIGVNPLMSMHLNPVAFLVDGIILYVVIVLVMKLYYKIHG